MKITRGPRVFNTARNRILPHRHRIILPFIPNLSDSDHCRAETVRKSARQYSAENRLMEKFQKLDFKAKERDPKPSTSHDSDKSKDSDDGKAVKVKDTSPSRNSLRSYSSGGGGKSIKGTDRQNTGRKKKTKPRINGKLHTPLQMVLRSFKKRYFSMKRRKGKSGAIVSDSRSRPSKILSKSNKGSSRVLKLGRGHRGECSRLSITSASASQSNKSSRYYSSAGGRKSVKETVRQNTGRKKKTKPRINGKLHTPLQMVLRSFKKGYFGMKRRKGRSGAIVSDSRSRPSKSVSKSNKGSSRVLKLGRGHHGECSSLSVTSASASQSRKSSRSYSSAGGEKSVKETDRQNTGRKKKTKLRTNGKFRTPLQMVLRSFKKGYFGMKRRKGRSGAIVSDLRSRPSKSVSKSDKGSSRVLKLGGEHHGECSRLSELQKENADVYEVEAILGKKFVKNENFEGYKYLVKWKNWSEEGNTWELEENLNNCPIVWAKFHEEFNRIYKRGFKRGMEVEKVCAVGFLDGCIHYLVQWKTDLDFTRVDLGDEYEWISKDEMRINDPQALLKFYDTAIEF